MQANIFFIEINPKVLKNKYSPIFLSKKGCRQMNFTPTVIFHSLMTCLRQGLSISNISFARIYTETTAILLEMRDTTSKSRNLRTRGLSSAQYLMMPQYKYER